MNDSLTSTSHNPRALAAASDLPGEIGFLSVELHGDFTEAALLRARWVVPVRQPLVLISQIQRSGGHLLAWLFDGHPGCINHPHELKWGRPHKAHWPSFDPNSDLTPDAAFMLLWEEWQYTSVAEGGFVAGHGQIGPVSNPFRFDPVLCEALFAALLAMRPVASRRDVLDAYLTASFNAWLDYRGLYAAPKRYVTAFVPEVPTTSGSLDRFFADYPDGRLVTIVRHPGSWLASALRSSRLVRQHAGEPQAALRIWSTSTEASVAAAARFGERVMIVFFDDLVHRTHDAMTRLCERLDLDFHPCLTTPTFNGMPIRSNSLFDPVEGLDPAATERHQILSPEQSAAVASVLPLYRDVLARYGLDAVRTAG